MLEDPTPARLPAVSPARSFPNSGAAGFAGPDVPSRITGAEKLMFGMLGGGWKLEGKPGGRPGCGPFICCIPGGGVVPGATIPGGANPGGAAEELVSIYAGREEEEINLPIPGGAPG